VNSFPIQYGAQFPDVWVRDLHEHARLTVLVDAHALRADRYVGLRGLLARLELGFWRQVDALQILVPRRTALREPARAVRHLASVRVQRYDHEETSALPRAEPLTLHQGRLNHHRLTALFARLWLSRVGTHAVIITGTVGIVRRYQPLSKARTRQRGIRFSEVPA